MEAPLFSVNLPFQVIIEKSSSLRKSRLYASYQQKRGILRKLNFIWVVRFHPKRIVRRHTNLMRFVWTMARFMRFMFLVRKWSLMKARCWHVVDLSEILWKASFLISFLLIIIIKEEMNSMRVRRKIVIFFT